MNENKVKEGTGIHTERAPWSASAAYLYLLKLDNVSLAWEYLRRNQAYQANWRDAALRSDSCVAARWGLRHLEDPCRDARAAEPLWCPTPALSLRLVKHFDEATAAKFQFWCIPGHKSLVHDGFGMLLTARHPPSVRRAVLDLDLATDAPYGFLIPAGSLTQDGCRAVREFTALYQTRATPNHNDLPERPTRSAVIHMRTLQAIDGAGSGASQREIARAIFGSSAVQAQWSPDSELRAQVRYFLRKHSAIPVC